MSYSSAKLAAGLVLLSVVAGFVPLSRPAAAFASSVAGRATCVQARVHRLPQGRLVAARRSNGGLRMVDIQPQVDITTDDFVRPLCNRVRGRTTLNRLLKTTVTPSLCCSVLHMSCIVRTGPLGRNTMDSVLSQLQYFGSVLQYVAKNSRMLQRLPLKKQHHDRDSLITVCQRGTKRFITHSFFFSLSGSFASISKGTSHHFVRAQRHEFEESIQYECTHTVLMNVNITRELLAHQILAHRNTSKVVFVQKSGFSLRKSKISALFNSIFAFPVVPDKFPSKKEESNPHPWDTNYHPS